MKHLIKPALLLLSVIFVIFVLPRLLPPRVELEPFGFYSGGNNEIEWAGLPPKYADPQLCTKCHQAKYSNWTKGNHASVSCEVCHGAGEAHIQQNDSMFIDSSREHCGRCHNQLDARPKDFPQIDPKVHGEKYPCVTCHNPHSPINGAGASIIPHSLQGRNDCLLCHGANGIRPYSENHAGRSSATCLNCHKEGK